MEHELQILLNQMIDLKAEGNSLYTDAVVYGYKGKLPEDFERVDINSTKYKEQFRKTQDGCTLSVWVYSE